jgi:hypothetical protein
VHTVTAISGQPVRHEVDDGWLSVRVPRIDEYEVLLVDHTA